MAKKNIDEAVMDLLVKVEKKKKEIAAAKTKPAWKTSCSIGSDGLPFTHKKSDRYGGTSDTVHDRVNIIVERDTNKIARIYAYLCQIEQSMKQAIDELGFDFEPVYLGSPISSWKDDLKTRAVQLSIEKKQKEIEELDKRVNKLVSPDQKREMELKAIQQMLDEENK